MRKTRKVFAAALTLAMAASLFTACSQNSGNDQTTAGTTGAQETTATGNETTAEANETTAEAPAGENSIELALHVLYNDMDANCYEDLTGASIVVTEEGQYTLSFDCATDLTDVVTGAGISTLSNLTAIYIKDEGIAKGEQSPLKGAQIKYDSVKVNDTELTITKADPKSAFKSNGQFDTNDPINSWDGSAVEEVNTDTANHVANFSTITDPTTISVTFTLSDFDWTGEGNGGSDSGSASGTNTYKNTAKFSDMDFSNMSTIELTKYLGNGINLGNTMEATFASRSPEASVDSMEVAWGQPITTAAMVQGMKDCGYDTLRIPIAWTSTMHINEKDYTISEEYFARIKEIVQYALDAEMFVIINDHWDYGWWAEFGSKEADEVEQAWDIYTSMWTQIAEQFKDYSDMLIFESANEELGNSLDDNGNWANSGYLKTAEKKYEVTNAINQKFVDIVRASGGNNENRFLLIAGYNTNIDLTCDDMFKMPTDTATDKLFISVHYYDPSNYCLAGEGGNGSRWGRKEEYEYMDTQVAKMKKFTDAGYGVIIGEYGALPVYQDGLNMVQPNTIEYMTYFVDTCEKLNFCPVMWTTNSIYIKENLDLIDPDLTALYTSHCYAEQVKDEAAFDAMLDTEMSALKEAAPEQWADVVDVEDGTTIAYIMWNGGAGTYNVGDKYDAGDCTAGITPHDVIIDGAGTYTVGLDFAGANDGLTFAALALNAGEDTYGEMGVTLDIKEIKINGEAIDLIATPYTNSDDGHCTRVNLINEWVSKLPDDAHNASGDLTDASPVIVDKTQMVGINTLEITFDVIINE